MTDGAPPGHDPKVVRTSLVDSGWSAPPPPLDEPTTEVQRLPLPTLPVLDARSLPSYAAHEAAAGSSMPDVTQVDRQVQSRAKAMREKDTLPPPRRASAFPPAPPPAPVVRAQEPPVVIQNASYATASAPPPSVRPPPPSVRPPPPVAPVA